MGQREASCEGSAFRSEASGTKFRAWDNERGTLVPGLQRWWWVQCLVRALLPPTTPVMVVAAAFLSPVDD